MIDLHLVDVFWTIQGEGYNSGRRALFIRMPYCNLRCNWCDTEFDRFSIWSEAKLKEFIQHEPSRFAVVTGGEPSIHKHTSRVVRLLKENGFFVAMESNGTHAPPEGVDFLTVSPKRFAKIPYYVCNEAMDAASEFRYVVDSEFDFRILDRHSENSTAHKYLSPEFSKFKENVDKIISYIKINPQWKISIQSHKFLGVA